MRITKIEQQRRNDKRYSVFIDEDFAFGLDGVDVLYYKLKEDMELSQEEYEDLIDNVVFIKARDRATHLLSYRRYTKKEMGDRLSEDYNCEVVEKVIELLTGYNYIDDAQYARDFIADKIKLKKLGRDRITYELRQKGIPRGLADEIFLEMEEDGDLDEVENALALLKKKAGSVDDKQRLTGYLLRRGYSYDVIREAFARLDDEE